MRRDRRVVTVDHLEAMRRALESARADGRPVLLLSAPGAGSSLGAMVFGEMIALVRADFPDVDMDWLLDCGDRAGAALNALRHGVDRLVFTGDGRVLEKLVDMAEQSGGRVLGARPGDSQTWPQT